MQEFKNIPIKDQYCHGKVVEMYLIGKILSLKLTNNEEVIIQLEVSIEAWSCHEQ